MSDELGLQAFEQLTPAEIELITPNCSNPESDVFVAQLPAGLNGAAYARYSRAPGGWKSVVLKEFLGKDGKVNVAHADALIERVLVQYGDDSVGELEGAHLSVENVSNVTVKKIEDGRIGVGYIEQSSRYVVYDQKDQKGNFRYLRDAKKNPIMESKYRGRYVKDMDAIFEIYTEAVEPMKDFFKKRKPQSEAKYDIRNLPKTDPNYKKPIGLDECKDEAEVKAWKRTYNFDIRTKTCDTLRIMLPGATLTNVGMFCNGRAYEYMIRRMLSSDNPEEITVGQHMLDELKKVVPHYVARAERDDYLVQTRRKSMQLAKELFKNIPTEPASEVYLHDFGLEHLARNLSDPKQLPELFWREFDLAETAQMVYPFVEHSFPQIINTLRQLPEEKLQDIRTTYVGARRTRRDKPGRALEYGYPLTFDLMGDFGIFRDMHRMRMMQQLREFFTTRYGFVDNADITEAGFGDALKRVYDISQNLFEDVVQDVGPEIAQNVVVFGAKQRFMMAMNDREAMHTLEIRTIPQGHPSYRTLAQGMHKAIKTQRPSWHADMMKFVDYNDYYWSRAESEARQRQKEQRKGIDVGDEA